MCVVVVGEASAGSSAAGNAGQWLDKVEILIESKEKVEISIEDEEKERASKSKEKAETPLESVEKAGVSIDK